MDIAQACETLWKALSTIRQGAPLRPTAEWREALTSLKAFMEAKTKRPIDALTISDELLATRQGLRYVMPYLLAAEAEVARAPAEPGLPNDG